VDPEGALEKRNHWEKTSHALLFGAILHVLYAGEDKSLDPTAVQNRQEQKEAFLLQAGSTQTRNSGSLQMPVLPYQVMAGTVIPAAMVTGIKSDLPGEVIATVTETVYDTATGRYPLIPQGSRLMGRYNS